MPFFENNNVDSYRNTNVIPNNKTYQFADEYLRRFCHSDIPEGRRTGVQGLRTG